MANAFDFDRITLMLNATPCAHICRYCSCSSASRKRSKLPLSRFETLVHRFHDWAEASGVDAPEIVSFIGPSFDYDTDTLEMVRRLRVRRGWSFDILNLGGQKFRYDETLLDWLDERQRSGIVGFHASFAGSGDTHDAWNGRTGDFDYQTRILRLGGERGMVRHERLFLAKNILPVFDRLLDFLENIPGEVRDRYACPFFYAGTAVRHECERLTEEDRDTLPDHIRQLRLWGFENWRSEREWLPLLMEAASHPREISLSIEVSEENIDRLEKQSCAVIFLEEKQRFLKSHASEPTIERLCERYGNRSGTKIYSSSNEVIQKLLDLHFSHTGASVSDSFRI